MLFGGLHYIFRIISYYNMFLLWTFVQEHYGIMNDYTLKKYNTHWLNSLKILYNKYFLRFICHWTPNSVCLSLCFLGFNVQGICLAFYTLYTILPSQTLSSLGICDNTAFGSLIFLSHLSQFLIYLSACLIFKIFMLFVHCLFVYTHCLFVCYTLLYFILFCLFVYTRSYADL